jgi:hypothetical protein
MANLQWWHFTKVHNGRLSAEKFEQFDMDEIDYDGIGEECADWAHDVNYDGYHRGFQYNWVQVDHLPVEYIQKQIKHCVDSIRHNQQEIERWKKLIPRKDKIEDVLKSI